MIHLKRNDKIILVVAIAVIVVAAIGIAAYNPIDDEPTGTTDQDMNMYMVTWEEKTTDLATESGYAGKKAPYENTISFNQGNLKSISFNLSWYDDKAFLGRLGRDTLTLEITTPDGDMYTESAQSAVSSRLGNVMLSINSINTKPSTDTIEAEDISEAEQMLNEEPYYNDKWENEDFTICVYCSVGEILGRFRPRDKGNSFELEISYEYYDAILQEEAEYGESDENSGDNMEESSTPNYLGMIFNTGYGRLF
jgi:hypothetical protein